MAQKLTIGLSLSLSGEYAAMGRQAEVALRLFVGDTNAGGGIVAAGQRYELALECIDDNSRRDRVAQIYRVLCFERRVDLVFGPYSSGLTRVAAPLADQAGMVLVNHGGADDDLHSRAYPMVFGVLTPASEYMTAMVRLLTTLKFWRKRVAIFSSGSPFARAVAGGVERACAERRARRRGVRICLKFAGSFAPAPTTERLARALRRNRINILLSAGSYAHDLAMMRLGVSPQLNIPVLGCIAAGVAGFHDDLSEDAEGIVGPSQWEEDVQVTPAIGPTPAEFVRRMRTQSAGAVDYPAAQIYAAGLVTAAAIRAADSPDQERLRRAFPDLRTSTFFGDFAIERATGRQTGHRMLLVQWHGGRKVIIEPEPIDDSGSLELPSGWRLLFGSQWARLRRRGDESDRAHERDDED